MSAENNFGRPANAGEDCVAVCAPGTVLSLLLFYERILLRPFDSPNTADDAGIQSDQLYDMLIQPETGAVDKLLFLAPSILFDPNDPLNSFQEFVQVESLFASPSWHYPVRPQLLPDNTIKVTTHNLHLKPASQAFESFEGTTGSAVVSLPVRLQNVDALGAMIGLRKTVFECMVIPPIAVGEKRWLRLRIKPAKMFPPGKIVTRVNPDTGFAGENFSQMLDILGADALLESFRDTLQNSLNADALGPDTLPDAREARFKTAISDLLVYTFQDGFEKAGTYTLIFDHRITLTAENAEIQPVGSEGSIKVEAIAPINSLGLLGFHWDGGLRFFAAQDPLVSANEIYIYAQKYAFSLDEAKSKESITYPVSVNYELGCAIIDVLSKEPWNYFRTENEGKSFYLNPEKQLPGEIKARSSILVAVAAIVMRHIRPGRAHFRIFFNCHWTQLTTQHKEFLKARKREKNLHLTLAAAGCLLGLLAIIISIILSGH